MLIFTGLTSCCLTEARVSNSREMCMVLVADCLINSLIYSSSSFFISSKPIFIRLLADTMAPSIFFRSWATVCEKESRSAISFSFSLISSNNLTLASLIFSSASKLEGNVFQHDQSSGLMLLLIHQSYGLKVKGTGDVFNFKHYHCLKLFYLGQKKECDDPYDPADKQKQK